MLEHLRVPCSTLGTISKHISDPLDNPGSKNVSSPDKRCLPPQKQKKAILAKLIEARRRAASRTSPIPGTKPLRLDA